MTDIALNAVFRFWTIWICQKVAYKKTIIYTSILFILLKQQEKRKKSAYPFFAGDQVLLSC